MKTFNKAVILSVCLSGGAMLLPTLADAGVAVDIGIAPPPPRVEVVPPPRVGYVWAPGYWAYGPRGHYWVGGRWRHERPGYHWVPDRWDPAGPRWHRIPGHWER